MKKLFLIIFLFAEFAPLYSQSWYHYQEDGIENRKITVKGISTEYLFPEGIPIEAQIRNDEDGYYFSIKYTALGTNFNGPIDIYSTDLIINIYMKSQDGQTYEIPHEKYYTELQVNGSSQFFLDEVFNNTGKIYFRVKTKNQFATTEGSTNLFNFSINSLGY